MKYKKIFILMTIIILIFLTICLLQIFISNINLNIKLYNENHSTQKGESSLYQYYEKNYCFSENEKQMISDRIEIIDVFDNEIFQVSECGDLRISFDVKDYDSYGYIYLYSNSSFQDLKEWLSSRNYNIEIDFYDTWISIKDDKGEILFYENKDYLTFRIIYITKLPYKYKNNEIDSFPSFVKYFLEINQKNIN